MKFDDKLRFPHPVLSDWTKDFKGGTFSIDYNSVKENYREDKITIHFKYEISEQSITGLLESNKAKFGFFLVCLDTHYNRLEEVDIEKGLFEITLSELHGRVRIRPVVWLEDVVDNFESDNLHDEFGGGPVKLLPGIVAVAEEQVIIVDSEKLAPWETIFTLAKSDEVPVGQFMVQTDEDKIKILAASSTYNFINQMRLVSDFKPVLLNSVYFPAVMEILSVLGEEPDQSIKEKRWYRTFNVKCESLGIDPENREILKDAQKLFKSPFVKLEKSKLVGSHD